MYKLSVLHKIICTFYLYNRSVFGGAFVCQTLDVLGLFLLLKSLEPNKDSISDQKGRQLWQKQVHKYRPVVERILGQFVTEGHQAGMEEFGRRCMEGIKEAR